MLQSCALVVLVVLAGAPVSAVVIDNFEEGPFSISGDTTTGFGSQSPLMAANAIADTREDSIQSGAVGQFATADLTLSAGDDALVTTLPASGGTLSLIYRPAPTDLTEGGARTVSCSGSMRPRPVPRSPSSARTPSAAPSRSPRRSQGPGPFRASCRTCLVSIRRKSTSYASSSPARVQGAGRSVMSAPRRCRRPFPRCRLPQRPR